MGCHQLKDNIHIFHLAPIAFLNCAILPAIKMLFPVLSNEAVLG